MLKVQRVSALHLGTYPRSFESNIALDIATPAGLFEYLDSLFLLFINSSIISSAKLAKVVHVCDTNIYALSIGKDTCEKKVGVVTDQAIPFCQPSPIVA